MKIIMEFWFVEECCDILDSMRVPITASDRESGIYPYYGANGIQDHVAGYIFDDELVLVETEMGILTIKGNDLKMNKLSIDNNELVVEGKIMALVYSEDNTAKKSGVFNKIFK